MNYADSVGAFKIQQSVSDCGKLYSRIVIFDEVGDSLCVSHRFEDMPLFLEIETKNIVVLDNPVVHNCNFSGAIRMRVRTGNRRGLRESPIWWAISLNYTRVDRPKKLLEGGNHPNGLHYSETITTVHCVTPAES